MNDSTNKTLNIALKVVAWILVAFTVLMIGFTIFTVATVDRSDRSIFGKKFYIVRTDSMSKSENNADMDVHFKSGDIVIVNNVDDPRSLQAGDIVSFISTNSDSYGETITHMIREVKKTDDGRVIGYVTYGTNTGTNDETLAEPEYILGVYAGKLPAAGDFFAFVKSTKGYIVCILAPLLLLIFYNGMNVIRLFRKYRREQIEDIQTQRAEIEAERAQAKRMMEELMALKAQLDQNGGASMASTGSTIEAAPEAALTEETKETKTDDSTKEEATDKN